MNYSELPPETRELAEKVIDVSEHLTPAWKSSPEEPFAIRRFVPSNSEDTQKFKDIDRHPKTLKYMVQDKPSSNKDLDFLLNIDETDAKDPRMMWAIVNEKNEPIGWVQYYKETMMTPEMRTELGITDKALVLEVSYAKLFNEWPPHSRFINERENLDTNQYGLSVPNGLKQSMIRMAQMEEFIAKEMGVEPRPIYIVGYTDPEYRASQIALAGNGFKNVGKTDYLGEMDNTWVKLINPAEK